MAFIMNDGDENKSIIVIISDPEVHINMKTFQETFHY